MENFMTQQRKLCSGLTCGIWLDFLHEPHDYNVTMEGLHFTRGGCRIFAAVFQCPMDPPMLPFNS